MEGVVNAGFWRGRRVLLTGHTGFKGAWLALWLERLGAEVTGLALPSADPKGAFSVLWGRSDGSHVVDIRDADAVAGVVASADPQTILHLAAQAFVRRSYAEPAYTYAVNVLGTAHLLAAASLAPSLDGVVVVTSDKVYANNGGGRPFTEEDPLGGKDPYSSSKACAELLTASWRESFMRDGRVAVATVRAGNVIGGGDRGEDRLLPDAWRAIEANRPLRLRYPGSTRPWQFVLEPLHGYLLVAESLSAEPAATPVALNFGPDPSSVVPVGGLIDRAFALWGSGTWEQEPGEHLPEARFLGVDSTLATNALGWRPVLELDTALAWTVEWWRAAAAGEGCAKVALAQLEAYEALVAA